MITRRAGFVVALVAAAGVAASCGKFLSEPSDFVIRVDSITGATAVSGGVAFEWRLWGRIGRDGCYSFKELRTARVPEQIDVTVIGHFEPGTCTQQPTSLDGVILHVDPIIPNHFSIVVHQPDGSTLVQSILGE